MPQDAVRRQDDTRTISYPRALVRESAPLSTDTPSQMVLSSEGAHIDQNQFNWLSTIFYLFFLGFEWPQNLALQRFPVGKWMRYVALWPPSVSRSTPHSA